MLLAKIYHMYLQNVLHIPKNDCQKKIAKMIFIFFYIFLGKTCRKTWTFTRVPQLEFVGEANEEITNVNDIGKQNASKK